MGCPLPHIWWSNFEYGKKREVGFAWVESAPNSVLLEKQKVWAAQGVMGDAGMD